MAFMGLFFLILLIRFKTFQLFYIVSRMMMFLEEPVRNFVLFSYPPKKKVDI